MIKALASLVVLISSLLPCSLGAMADTVPRNVVTELAPSGKLRAAINFGNIVLAQKDPAGGDPRGFRSALTPLGLACRGTSRASWPSAWTFRSST